jgi:hypothetical protein
MARAATAQMAAIPFEREQLGGGGPTAGAMRAEPDLVPQKFSAFSKPHVNSHPIRRLPQRQKMFSSDCCDHNH